MGTTFKYATLASLIAALCAPAAYATSLQEAVKKTVETNPEIMEVIDERRARDEEVRQAKSGYLPKLDFIAGVGKERIDDARTRALDTDDDWETRKELGLNLSQNLFLGFGTESEVDRQEARVKSMAYTIQGTAQNTALRAIETYLNVLRMQELLTAAEDNVAVHEKIYEQIKLRSESGVGQKADLEQISGRLALARSNVIAVRINLQDAETNYFRVVGEMPDSLANPTVPAEFLPTSMDDAVQRAIDNHPTLKSANADVESAQAQDRAAKANFYPRLDLEASYAQEWDEDDEFGDAIDDDDADNETQIMLRLRYNLYNGGYDKARKNQTAHLINEAYDVRDNTLRQVVESVRLSWAAYDALSDQLKYKKEHFVATGETRETYKKQFDIGKRTLLDVLDTENEYVESKIDYIDTSYDGQFAAYRILRGTGQLLEALAQPLPEEALVEEEEKEAQEQEAG